MKLALVKTPKVIKPDLLSACRVLSRERPVFVGVSAPAWALSNKCPFNAKRFAEENNGEVIFGWSVSIWNKVLLDCIGHAIVKLDKQLVDVTPNKHGDAKILFLPDQSLKFDYTNPMSRMPSRMLPISKFKEVKRLISIEKEIYNIKIKYPVMSGTIALEQSDGQIVSQLEDEKQSLVLQIIRSHTHHNDPCVCGSGRKFRKCCQQRLPQ